MLLPIAISLIAAFIFIGGIFIYKSVRKRLLLKKAEEEALEGKDREAEKKLLAILEEHPDDFEAFKELIILYFTAKSYKKALEKLEEALNKPEILSQWDQKDIMIYAGIAARKLKKKQKAYKYFLTVAGLEKDNPDAIKNLAILEYEFGNYQKADKYFKKAYMLKGKVKFDKEFVKTFGINNYYLSKFEDAVKILNAYIQKYPNDIEARFFIGASLYHLGQYNAAIDHLKYGIYSPKYRDRAYFFLGNIYYMQKDKQKALTLLLKCVKLDKVSKEILLEAYYIIAEIYRENGDISNAVIYWKKIVNKDKNFRDVIDKLNKYAALSANEKIRKFTLMTKNDFVRIAKKFIGYYLGNFHIERMETIDESILDILVIKVKKNKKDFVYFRFIRDTNTIGELTVKEFYYKMKEHKCRLGVLITVGPLSNRAKDFIAARPIDLYDKAKLGNVLNEIM